MFIIRKTFSFEASHQLEHHDGKCARVHGHSYKMEVELASHTLQSHGTKKNMVMDFEDISAVVKKLVHEHLDHRHLNESLDTDSPTAEFIAQWVYYRLKNALPLLRSITIRETHSSSVTYSPNECTCKSQRPVPYVENGTRANGEA